MRVRHCVTETWRRLRPAALGIVASLLPMGAVLAQGEAQPVYVIKSGNAELPDLDVRTLRSRGFQLFSSGDAAFYGGRTTGNFGFHITNYGDCAAPNTYTSCQAQQILATRGGDRAPFFHLEWVYGTPPSAWLKIRQVAPSVNDATGGGYMANAGEMFISRPIVFGPKDGTLGTLFSGATATTDGSCFEHENFANGFDFGSPEGLQLLPGSDCPETWGSMGWQGAHPIDLDGYKALFDQLGSAFEFDFWRVPDSLQRLDKMFLGSGVHAYGEASDYNLEQQALYGSVAPNGGGGAPKKPGYPLGLDIHFEMFSFAVPTVAGVKWVQQFVVNNSANLYGTGIDYDSLYFGLSQGTLFASQGISMYAVPEMGMVAFHENNAQGATGPCGDAARTTQQGCQASSNLGRGYGNGAVGIIVLKSPYGDLRNKLFTRTPSGAPCTVGVDPFCDPTHPSAGDTITFNQSKFGGFGGADAATWGFSARASFGYLSGTEENTLDGRSPADLPSWQTFRNIGFPAVQGVFNKYVPGAPGSPGAMWDYNDDGQADTLFFDTCGPAGCAVISSDTLANGFVNSFGNIGGVIATGPVQLAAGDTMAWSYAVVGDGDSTKFWSQVNAAIDLYLNFFLAPEAPPSAEVVSTQVQPASDEFGSTPPQVQFFFSDDPERWVDPFLAKAADDITNAAPGTPLNDLLVANPGVDALVRARAADNIESLEIYKSCDGGTTFTSDADCDGETATDERGNSVGFGWQAYATFDVDASPGGNLPNSFTDADVEGGQTYLYVVIAKTRGANFLLTTATGPDSVVFAPSIRNVLSRSSSDPNVVSVYVPASRPAGFQPADTVFTTRPAGPTVPFTVNLTDNVVPGSYRAAFGNEVLVARDSSINDAAPLGSVVYVQRRETVDAAGVGVDSVIRRVTFTYAPTDEFVFAGSGVTGAPVVSGDSVRTITTYSGLGYVLATGADEALYGGNTLTGDDATPSEAFNRPAFPNFTLSVNNTLADAFNSNRETQLRGSTSIGVLGLLEGDTVVPRNIVNGFMVQWQEGLANRTADAGGIYEVTWSSDPFGTDQGFAMNFANPAATEAAIRAALEARPAATTGLTDDSTAALIGVPQTELVPVNVPFTVRNLSLDRPVSLAMQRRVNDRLRLGNRSDTISVQLPPDQWAPGDVLIFIEEIEEDETTAAGLVLDASGSPQTVTRRAVTFTAAVLGCNTSTNVLTARCNPLAQREPGASGYNPMQDGDRTQFEYYVGLAPTSEYAFGVTEPITSAAITAVTDSALSLIRVVPNPFIIFSTYQTSLQAAQLLFTGLPPRGTLRIYTVAGQFAQEINWDPADLDGDGDLFWNMQTREGIDIASGLYIWVVTAPTDPNNPASAPLQARGKFVVIRGDNR